MAVVRKRWIVLGVAVAVVVAYNLLANWYDEPLRRARRISGLEIPSSSKLLYAEDTTSGVFDEGYALFVFAIPSEFEPTSEGDCNRLRYKYGEISVTTLPTWNGPPEQHFDPSRVSCHYFEGNYEYWKLIVIQSQQIVVYVEFN